MTDAVFYFTKLGTTGRIAKYIAESIGAELVDLGKEPYADPSKYDRVILGSGVYGGYPSKNVRDFMDRYEDEASGISLFLVCAFRDDRAAGQLEKISEDLGVADSIFFNRPKKMIGVEGSKLELYIESLKK
ncbi:MAG: hypothetical protein GX137_06475 [Thermoplasmatales archaeon]|jgi:menaquinone-dependent protoporphyrinogen IX oxidase|nr:hypothetical protein [Thermoplasmatales archaeon]